MKLTVYTDDMLTEVSRVVEADKLKIPYKVTLMVIKSLEGLNLSDNDEVFKAFVDNVDGVDKIIRCTFGLSEEDLNCVDTLDLIETGKEIFSWAIEKVNSIQGGQKNASMRVSI